MNPDRGGAPPLAAIHRLAAQIFGPHPSLNVERSPAGVSTFVYRIARGQERFYLRVLPEIGASFLPESRAHTLLRERGVSVPAIIHAEHRNAALGLSVMVTTEIAGRSVAAIGLTAQSEAVLFAAGRDLALVNSVPVAGFGWIRRDRPSATLTAALPTNRAFLTEHLEADLALLQAHALNATECATLRAIIAHHDAWLDTDQAWLAHGDLDLTHIYQHAGTYSGIIDFGEIRGADRWYDLGHFRLHDGERLPHATLPWLLAGYRSVAPLPADADQRIAFASLLIGIRTLARTLHKRPSSPLVAHCLRAIGRDVAFLARG